MRTIAAVAAGILAGAAGLAGGRVLAALEDPKPAAAAAAAAPCTPVAFVNLTLVFKSSARVNKVQQTLTAQQDKQKEEIARRKQDLRKRYDDLQLKSDPGTEEYEKERRDIEMKGAEIDYDEKAAEAMNAHKVSFEMAGVYKDICAEVERIATARGFACVFNRDSDPIAVESRGHVISPEDLKTQIALRTAVWSKPELDLTKDVIEALNK